MTLELGGVGEQARLPVGLGGAFGQIEVALGVVGVVVFPVGDG